MTNLWVTHLRRCAPALVGVVVATAVVACATGDDVDETISDPGGRSGAAGLGGAGVGGGAGSGGAPSGASGGAFGVGICGTEAATDDNVLDLCLTANCCPSFETCMSDVACSACLDDGTGTACGANGAYAAFVGCGTAACTDSAAGAGGSDPAVSTTICGTGAGTDDDRLNACLTVSCCAAFDACEHDDNCFACLAATGGSACDSDPLLGAFIACGQAHCVEGGGAP